MSAFAVLRIDHVELYVRDIEASVRWYADALGLTEIMRWDPEPVMIGAGGTKLALFRTDAASPADKGPHGNPAPHWHRVAWLTDGEGFAAVQQALKARAVAFRGPIDHGIAQSIYFTDPDGNPLEVTYYVSGEL